MTAEQIEICMKLGSVRYLPASFNKRLGQSLCAIAEHSPQKELSASQNEWMYRLLYRYRKQLPNTYDKYKANEFCNKLTTKKQQNL